ncbi:hypothetical protein PV326_000447 [Microctonus aethiopoides]|nr:hypothetical protein PV326_000447 [Microctonus aethiopoides]
MGSDVMGFPTDVRGENLSVLATQSTHSTQGREQQRSGTSDPISEQHSREIWESKESSLSTISLTNQRAAANYPLCSLTNQSAIRRLRRGRIKGNVFGPNKQSKEGKVEKSKLKTKRNKTQWLSLATIFKL